MIWDYKTLGFLFNLFLRNYYCKGAQIILQFLISFLCMLGGEILAQQYNLGIWFKFATQKKKKIFNIDFDNTIMNHQQIQWLAATPAPSPVDTYYILVNNTSLLWTVFSCLMSFLLVQKSKLSSSEMSSLFFGKSDIPYLSSSRSLHIKAPV